MDDIGILVLCHSYKKVAFSGHLSKSGLVNCIYGEKLIWITACLGRLVLNSRPSQCVAGCTCSLVPLEKKKRPCSLVPQKQNLDFLCSLFPKIACVPLFPLFLGLFSPVPLKKCPCSPFPKNPWEGLKF